MTDREQRDTTASDEIEPYDTLALLTLLAWLYLRFIPDSWPLSNLDPRWTWAAYGAWGIALIAASGRRARARWEQDGWSPRTLGAIAISVVGFAIGVLAGYRIAELG